MISGYDCPVVEREGLSAIFLTGVATRASEGVFSHCNLFSENIGRQMTVNVLATGGCQNGHVAHWKNKPARIYVIFMCAEYQGIVNGRQALSALVGLLTIGCGCFAQL